MEFGIEIIIRGTPENSMTKDENIKYNAKMT